MLNKSVMMYDVCAGKIDLAVARGLLRDLLDVFEVVLLPTHGSCFVQFLVFYICSLHQVCVHLLTAPGQCTSADCTRSVYIC